MLVRNPIVLATIVLFWLQVGGTAQRLFETTGNVSDLQGSTKVEEPYVRRGLMMGMKKSSSGSSSSFFAMVMKKNSKKKKVVKKKKMNGKKKKDTNNNEVVPNTDPEPYAIKLYDPLDAHEFVWPGIYDTILSATEIEATLATINSVYRGMVTRESVVFYMISLLCAPTDEDIAGANRVVDALVQFNPEGFSSFDDLLLSFEEDDQGNRNLQELFDFKSFFTGGPTPCSSKADGQSCAMPNECTSNVCSDSKCGIDQAKIDREALTKRLVVPGEDTAAVVSKDYMKVCLKFIKITNPPASSLAFDSDRDALCKRILRKSIDEFAVSVVGRRVLWAPAVFFERNPITIPQQGVDYQPFAEGPMELLGDELEKQIKPLAKVCIIYDEPKCDVPDSMLNNAKFFEFESIVKNSKTVLKNAYDTYKQEQGSTFP